MTIWVLYTECDSEPTFWWYVKSKKRAVEWCIEQLEDRGCKPDKLIDCGDIVWAELQDDSHFVHAQRIEWMRD